MKKRVVLAVICMTFAVAACGKKTVNDAEVTQEQSQEPSQGQSEELTDDASDVEASEDAYSSADEDSASSNPADNLYEAFISNAEKAYFDEIVSDILPAELKREFDLSKAYTVDEIIETSLSAYKRYDDSKGEPSVETSYIDCGIDGKEELLLEIRYPGMEDSEYAESGDEYVDHWVIKEIDDKLFVKFFGGSRQGSYTVINQNGYVENITVGAYNGVLPESYGYLDKDADWVLYYRHYYYLDMGDYAREKALYGVELDLSSEDWNNMQVEEYIFDDEAEVTEVDQNGFITYFKIDDAGVVDDKSIYEDSSVYKKTFDNASIVVCPYSDVEERLKERRAEIGLTDEIMQGGAGAEETALSESVSYSVCKKEVKSEDDTDLFHGEYIQLLSADSSLESVITKINNDIEKDNLEKIEEYSTFAQDNSENIINSGMPYYLKPTEVFTEKNDDEILSIGIMREGYTGGSMNNMLDFYNINLAEGMLINMDQLISVSDENAKKIVEGLSEAYFDGNMSKEYQAEAVDAFNNGQTQFSIQDDGSIKIYFYQDTVNIPVSWAAVCVEVDSKGDIIRVFE